MTMNTQTVTNSERKQKMVRSRLGLKALGLCALLLGLMAFASSAAQAETNAHWNIITAAKTLVQVNGTNKLFAQLEIKELEGSSAELLFTTKSGTKVSILCTSAKFDEGGLLQASGGISLGRILFKGCLTKLNGVASGACKPSGGGTAEGSGEILTERGKGLIVLDEVVAGVKEDYVKITPENEKGETTKLFSQIKLGKECSIGESVPVEAKTLGEGIWIKDCGPNPNASFEEEKLEHLIEESLHQLIALGQPATIDGSALVKLAGAHLNLEWGGTPQ
jgi:hypothetical protein